MGRTISIGLLVVALAAVGLQAAEKAAAPKSKGELMQGEWKITTVGTRGQHGQKTEALSQTLSLTFNEKAVKGKAIEGKPFGFEISSSKLGGATAGGAVSFTTSYKRGPGTYNIDWKGKLSEDGTQLTDGKFSFILGAGTFTAEKVVAAAKKTE